MDTDGLGCVGCAVLGELGVIGILIVAALFLFWLAFLVFVPLVIVPVLEIFAPFGDRITIVAGDRRLVLRDLRDAPGFIQAVAPRVRVYER